jgi:hypothetical protein
MAATPPKQVGLEKILDDHRGELTGLGRWICPAVVVAVLAIGTFVKSALWVIIKGCLSIFGLQISAKSAVSSDEPAAIVPPPPPDGQFEN